MIFTIDTDNEIVAHETAPAARDGVVLFATEKELAKVASGWPMDRLVETWNGFAGVAPFSDLKPVKKFENREKATRRIWAAIQKLALAPKVERFTDQENAALQKANTTLSHAFFGGPTPIAACTASGRARKAGKAKVMKTAKGPRQGTAKANVLAMIQRTGGATLDEIRAATGWQPHTVRGFISVVPKRAGLTVTSTRRAADKARVYKAR